MALNTLPYGRLVVTVERGSALSDQTCSMNVVVEAVKAGDVLVMCIPPMSGVWCMVLIFCIGIGTSS